MSTLYVVATPIGNLEDLTARAARILGEVDRVVAEDTRRTSILLRHLGLRVPLSSLHAHNEAARTASLIEWLDAGETVALVSDAGTPVVSDPGERTVDAVRSAGHEVVPVPGPSAVLAALVGSGLPAERFAFLGFVPRKGADRRSTLARIAESSETTIVFESPERLVKLLEALHEVAPGRAMCVARELTKVHEEFRRGTAAELEAYYREAGVRGEVTLVVSPAPASTVDVAEDQEDRAREMARERLRAGDRPSRVARDVSRETGVSRNRAYELVQLLREADGAGDVEQGADGATDDR